MKRISSILFALILLLSLAACGGTETSTENNNNNNNNNETAEAPEVDEELEKARQMLEPLGEIPIPEDNPMTDEKIELGKLLFFDNRLSGDGKQSCMSCHAPGAGWADGLPTFVGFEGAEGPRNSPSIINAGYYEENFWDGRAGSLEEQAAGPITSPIEMNQDLDKLVEILKDVPEYVERFDDVFGEEITKDNILKALAAFERTIVINDTDFDKFLKGDDDAISEQAKEGLKLYVDKANCITCHSGALLSDNQYHNLGIEGDDGRYEVTEDEDDLGAFRTPGLRGVTYTAPYMHDGSIETLREVIEFYNEGGGDHPNKSPLMPPLNLTDDEIDALVALLESMAGDNILMDTPEIP